MVGEVIEALGRIDVLVNNAGVLSQSPLQQMPVKEWDRVLIINLRGTFLCCRFALPHMLGRGEGRIFNVASQLGQVGAPELAHYCASIMPSESEEQEESLKAALPTRRFGAVEEVVPTVVFLASDEASYYVGQTLGPNGGDVML
jgi:3-oxoacyl-[acyl-carrier protein] reductase